MKEHETQVGSLEGQQVGFTGLCMAGACLGLAALWGTLEKRTRWFRLKRVCAWCKPPRWMGGNPFAKRVTHGLCNRCFKEQMKAAIERRAV